AVDALLPARETHQLLLPFRAHGHEQPAAHLQLLEQRLRNDERRRGDEDAIEGRLWLPPRAAVAMPESDIAHGELLQPLLGAIEQRLDALDGVDALHERREHRGLIAA